MIFKAWFWCIIIFRAKQRAIEKAREKELEMEMMESQFSEELSGDESVHEILQRFTIVEKSRLNYLHKIFHDYQAEEEHPYLSHQVHCNSWINTLHIWSPYPETHKIYTYFAFFVYTYFAYFV